MNLLKAFFKISKQKKRSKLIKLILSSVFASSFLCSSFVFAASFDDISPKLTNFEEAWQTAGDCYRQGKGWTVWGNKGSCKISSPLSQYEQYAPILQSWPSYGQAGFDCRSLIGGSTPQNYQATYVTPYRQTKTDAYNQYDYTEMPDNITYIVPDPDHDFKACLIYQAMTTWLNSVDTNGNSAINNPITSNSPPTNFKFSGNMWTSPAPTNSVFMDNTKYFSDDMPALSANYIRQYFSPLTIGDNPFTTGDQLIYLRNNPMYWEGNEELSGKTPFNLPNKDLKGGVTSPDFVKWFYYMAIAQQSNDIFNGYLTDSSKVTSKTLSSEDFVRVNQDNFGMAGGDNANLNRRLWTDLMRGYQGDDIGGAKITKRIELNYLSGGGMFGQVTSRGVTINPLSSLSLCGNGDYKCDPFRASLIPWLKLEDWLGYSSNLSVMSNTLDGGTLFKDSGRPNLGLNGSLVVGFDNTQAYGVDNGDNGYNQAGLDSAVVPTRILSTGASKCAGGCSDKGLLTTTVTLKSSSGMKKLFEEAVKNGDQANKPLTSIFVNGAKEDDKDQGGLSWSDTVIKILNAAISKSTSDTNTGVIGFTDNSGYYKGANGMLVSTGDKLLWTFEPKKIYANAMCQALLGLKNCSEATIECSEKDTTDCKLHAGIVDMPIGDPLCGSPRRADVKKGKIVIGEQYLGSVPSATEWPIESVPTQPFMNSRCDLLRKALKDQPNALDMEQWKGKAEGSSTFVVPTEIFGGADSSKSNASWWNVGKSYLIVNKMLAQNVQKLVDNINKELVKEGITSGLAEYIKPFVTSGNSFIINSTQNLKFSIQFTGGVNGSLNLTYVPASQVSDLKSRLTGVPLASNQKSVNVSSPLSRNFLLLAIQNKPFETSTKNNETLSASSGIGAADKVLLRKIQGLPDNLAKPLEYFALYNRVINAKKDNKTMDNSGGWKGPMTDTGFIVFKKRVSKMIDVLSANGLATDDLSNADEDKSAVMFSSINSALSSIYTSITPQQMGGGASGFINPQKIEGDLQKIYSFGDSSGSAGSSAKGMVGKQYDFLTQIQQLGVHMVGDVVDNLYQISDTYTNVFNSNSALISNNLSDTLDGAQGVQNFYSSSYQDAKKQMDDNKKPDFTGDTANLKALQKSRIGLGAGAAGIAAISAITCKTAAGFGAGCWVPIVGGTLLNLASDGIGAKEQSINDGMTRKLSSYQNKMLDIQNNLSINNVRATNMMLNVQTKQLELSKMSYEMMVNMTKSMMLLPLAFVVLTMLFSAGIQFALIIPMTPYIIFWAGQTSWLLNTIEAMVAAPLVCLTLLHPGGHSYYGHSNQAYKMLINVVLKPVLLVFGTLASMVLIYIIVVYSAQGFHTMGNSIVGSFMTFNYGKNPDGTYQNYDRVTNVRAILSLMLIFMYSTFLTMVFNKCFSVIYVIPEKVVQWLGGQSDSFGKEDAQQLAQASQQQASQVGQAGQQSTQGVASGSKDMSSAKGQSAQSQGQSGIQMATSGANNTSALSSQAGNSSSGAGHDKQSAGATGLSGAADASGKMAGHAGEGVEAGNQMRANKADQDRAKKDSTNIANISKKLTGKADE